MGQATRMSAVAAFSALLGAGGAQIDLSPTETLIAASTYEFIDGDPVRAAQMKIVYDDIMADVEPGDEVPVGQLGAYLMDRLDWDNSDEAALVMAQEINARMSESIADAARDGALSPDEIVDVDALMNGIELILREHIGDEPFSENRPDPAMAEALRRDAGRAQNPI